MSQNQSEYVPPAEDLLAAEYVLGTLVGEEREAFKQRMHRDTVIREGVQQWESQLGQLAEAVPEVSPPAQAWGAIEERLGWREAVPAVGFWASLRLWQGVSAVSTAAVAVLMLLLVNTSPLKPEMLYLVQDQGKTEWIVNASYQQGRVAMKAVNPPSLPQEEVCKLWIKSEDGTVHPIGILPHEGEVTFSIEALRNQLLSVDAELMVTVERRDRAENLPPVGNMVSQGKWIHL